MILLILSFKNDALHVYTFFRCSVYSHIACVSFLYVTGASSNGGCQHYFRFYYSTIVCIVFFFRCFISLTFCHWHKGSFNQLLFIFSLFLSHRSKGHHKHRNEVGPKVPSKSRVDQNQEVNVSCSLHSYVNIFKTQLVRGKNSKRSPTKQALKRKLKL